MKFATCVLLFDQQKWILKNLENAYPHVDKIYVMYSKLPFGYNPKARETYINTLDLDIIKYSKYMDKITIVEGDWLYETDERNVCVELAKKDGIDYLIVQDADHFYFHEHFEKIKNAVRNNPDYEVYFIGVYDFWKSFKYIVIHNNGTKISAAFPGVLNLHKMDKYMKIDTDVNYINYMSAAHISDVVCYHGSYVLTDEEVYKKIKTVHYTIDFDTDKWYNEIWLPWTLETKCLHPVWPWAWDHCEIFNDKLPEVIENFE
jgi:hypothetical protein